MTSGDLKHFDALESRFNRKASVLLGLSKFFPSQARGKRG